MKRERDIIPYCSERYLALCAQRDALDAQCNECIRPLHEAVFALQDVIFKHILEWLARHEPIRVIARLAELSSAWRDLVRPLLLLGRLNRKIAPQGSFASGAVLSTMKDTTNRPR